MTVHLRIAFASEDPCHIRMLNDDGTEHCRMDDACRSFRRIQRDGEWWRLAGQDRTTAHMIYMREMVEVA